MLSVGAQRDHQSYSLPSTWLNEMLRGKLGLNEKQENPIGTIKKNCWTNKL